MKSIIKGDKIYINFELIKSWLDTEREMTCERLRLCDTTDRSTFHYCQGRLNAIDSTIRFLKKI